MSNDPRSIDPEAAETDEDDVAQQDGSSTALADEEERQGHRLSASREADEAALRAMPDADGSSADQVASRQPDSEND